MPVYMMMPSKTNRLLLQLNSSVGQSGFTTPDRVGKHTPTGVVAFELQTLDPESSNQAFARKLLLIVALTSSHV